jgi:hypothetical protein
LYAAAHPDTFIWFPGKWLSDEGWRKNRAPALSAEERYLAVIHAHAANRNGASDEERQVKALAALGLQPSHAPLPALPDGILGDGIPQHVPTIERIERNGRMLNLVRHGDELIRAYDDQQCELSITYDRDAPHWEATG